ncbi:ribonuclease III [Bergeyella sp. RCAD1439]|uniref:ribonuclease III n=1 Tax=Bergeyella anatis TaxID=3113737 RepID=UPI002E19D904|nr:ribonuclease III [Bergeyella sp. RCAD1439]
MELRKYFSKFLTRKPPKRKIFSERDLRLGTSIQKIIGQPVRHIELYREAFSLKVSSEKNNKNYERLEFLGDSILGSVIAFYLYQTYPSANEGFLTQMKSKIVNRKNLNKIGDELKLKSLIQNPGSSSLSENISGNLFEALIGAVYLDIGYEACQNIILQKLLTAKDINKLENKIVSYKSLLLEWSQKRKVALRYETHEEHQGNKTIVFRSHVMIDNQKIANAVDTSKKKSEEKAAQRAFYTLNKKEHILEKNKTFS